MTAPTTDPSTVTVRRFPRLALPDEGRWRWLADPRLGLAAAVIVWLIVIGLAAPLGRPLATGQEAIAYWSAQLADPYANSEWTIPPGYVYSPAFLQLVAPIAWLPWVAFMGVWTAILLVALRSLTGGRWFLLGVLAAFFEIAGGNISLLLGLAIVVGFRYPAAWAFVLLTKITPRATIGEISDAMEDIFSRHRATIRTGQRRGRVRRGVRR